MNDKKRAVHVATITRRQNGKTYVTHLLRHTYRENGKVKQLTLGNLSDLPDDLIRVIRNRLSGQPLPNESDDFQIIRSLPHGHVAAVLGMLRKIGLDRLIASKPCREAQLVIAMIVLRIMAPGSKLANLTSLHPETAEHSLADELQLEEIETPELYEALDWLLKRQTRIENKLARKHFEDGTLVLYDVSSSYYTGRQSDLIRMGYSRDGNPLRGKEKIGLRIGRELKSTKMQKHFELTIKDESFSYRRKTDQIAAEAALDGLYVVRTSTSAETLSSEQTVLAYKSLLYSDNYLFPRTTTTSFFCLT